MLRTPLELAQRHILTHTASAEAHTHSSTGGFHISYDSSTMAVVGSGAHRFIMVSQQLTETEQTKDKVTPKQQKSSLSHSAQCCVVPPVAQRRQIIIWSHWRGGRSAQGGSHVQYLHAVILCLCVLRRVCIRLRWPESLFIVQVWLHKCRFLENQLFTGLWAVLHIYDSVVSLQSLPQLNVDFALYIHEHQSASKTNGHHDKLGPKRPFKYPYRKEEQTLIKNQVTESLNPERNSPSWYRVSVMRSWQT